jgi:23S rRNA pseudouridine1911/1915/1917 synthase
VNAHLSIVFEDDHCLAVAKPPGQFTVGDWAPAGGMTLETEVRRHLAPADPRAAYLGIVHRLDRPSSGLLLWAKTPKAARRLSAQFEKRKVVKEYWAIVEHAERECAQRVEAGSGDVPTDPSGLSTWRDWLTRADERGLVSVVASQTPGAREAVARWRRDEARSLPLNCGWLRLWPETGRTHQLRIQTARRGMPILGDRAYGSTLSLPVPEGIALHARSLQFRHPITGIEITLAAPLPSLWTAAGIILPAASSGPWAGATSEL